MISRGFTLLELILTLSVTGVLLVLGLPAFSSQIQTSHVKSITDSLMDSLSTARSGAVTQNTRMTVTGTQGWSSGWEVFVDTNNDGVRSTTERLVSTQEKITAVYIIPNKPLKKYVSFIGSGEARMTGSSNGGAKQMGTFRICPIKQGAGYMLVLSPGGRIRKSEISAQECALYISKL